jgi:hypothetical protein
MEPVAAPVGGGRPKRAAAVAAAAKGWDQIEKELDEDDREEKRDAAKARKNDAKKK